MISQAVEQRHAAAVKVSPGSGSTLALVSRNAPSNAAIIGKRIFDFRIARHPVNEEIGFDDVFHSAV